jgi:hypothetical protein
MRSPRFSSDQIAVLQQLDPDAIYHPPSRPGAGDDFVELADGACLPNPDRAADWIKALPAGIIHRVAGPPEHAQPAHGRTRRHLTVIEGGRRAS